VRFGGANTATGPLTELQRLMPVQKVPAQTGSPVVAIVTMSLYEPAAKVIAAGDGFIGEGAVGRELPQAAASTIAISTAHPRMGCLLSPNPRTPEPRHTQ
jgi:hypothetical protein